MPPQEYRSLRACCNNHGTRSPAFDRTEDVPIDIEWRCIKDGATGSGDDAGYLDRLRITQPSSSINLKVRVYLEGALE